MFHVEHFNSTNKCFKIYLFYKVHKFSPLKATNIYLKIKDFSVTGEKFDLIYDEERDMLMTSPRPTASELSKYYESENYISHTDSRLKLSDKLYHLVKRHMLKKKLSWINKKIPSKGKILDIGAGTGDFLLEAKKQGWKVRGVEPSTKARSLAAPKGIAMVENCESFKSDKFDVITLWHVLEHVGDLKTQIIEIEHLLKRNGLLIIAVPNFKSYDAQYYKEYWAAFDVPRHLWHFSRQSFNKIMEGTTLKQSDSKPLIFDSIYVSMLSEKYKTGRSNIFSAFWVGLKSNWMARTTSEYSSIAYFFRKTR
ncbi:class I SAM-dependent methyltransferase [soil metagenome]